MRDMVPVYGVPHPCSGSETTAYRDLPLRYHLSPQNNKHIDNDMQEHNLKKQPKPKPSY